MVRNSAFAKILGVIMSGKSYFAETKSIDYDDKVDKGIQDCLSIGSGKSFITFAGAGSGKTYSLKKALDFLKSQYSDDFSRQGKQIAVVTFTNNAADEIKDRKSTRLNSSHVRISYAVFCL